MTYDEIKSAWNSQASETNQWDDLGEDEKIEWAASIAVARIRAQEAQQESDHFDMHDLLIGAVRYYLNTPSALSAFFAHNALAPAWESLHPDTQLVLQQDIETAFFEDDVARQSGDDSKHPLGMDCHRNAWEAVRDKWCKEATPPERTLSRGEIATSLFYLAEDMRVLAGRMPDSSDDVLTIYAACLLSNSQLIKHWVEQIDSEHAT